MDFGFSSSEALSEFGIIMGMTFPLLMIPSTLISSLAVTMIPSISEQSNDFDHLEVKNKSVLRNKINFALKITVVFSTILLPIYLALGKPICSFIFDNEKAGIYLTAASFLMLPLGLSQITSSILNAIGLELKSLKNYVISALFLIVSILFLPKYIGTYSLIVGYLAMSTISSILNIAMLKKRNILGNAYIKTMITMLLISVMCALLGYFISNLISNLFISIFISVGVIVVSMAMLIYSFNIADFKIIIMKKVLRKS